MSVRSGARSVAPPLQGRRLSRLDEVLSAGKVHGIDIAANEDAEGKPEWLKQDSEWLPRNSQVFVLKSDCDEALERAEEEKDAMIQRSAARQQELLMELVDLENRLRLSGNEYNEAIVTERDMLRRKVAACRDASAAGAAECAKEKAELNDKLARWKNATDGLAQRIRADEGSKIDKLKAQEARLERRLAELNQMVERQEAFLQGMFPSREE